MPRIYNFTINRTNLNKDTIVYTFTSNHGGTNESFMGVIRNLDPNLNLTNAECENLVEREMSTQLQGVIPDNNEVDISY